MDSTIKRIIGEEDDSRPDDLEKKRKKVEEPAAPIDSEAGPEDTKTDELSHLWNSGNKNEVVRRFLEMDNESSVKLVFAIEREGALELARMTDEALRQAGPEGGNSPGDEDIAQADIDEPEQIKPTQDHTVREIIGHPHVMPV